MNLKNPLKQEVLELNSLYSGIISVCGSYNKMGLEEKELAKKVEIITNGIEQDESIVFMLKESNKRISEELNTAKENYKDIKRSMKAAGELVRKLEKMDFIQTELTGLKRFNTSMRLKVTPLSAKVWKVQEELFNLRKEKKQILKEHSEIMTKSKEFVGLRTKILPLGELLDIKDRLTVESARLEKYLKEVGHFKEELARLVPMRDNLKQELETTLERLSSVQEHINSMKEKIKKLAPRSMPEEDIKRLEDSNATRKKKKNLLTEEKKQLSPSVASTAEEEENLTTILESYQVKSKRDKDKLSALKKDMKEMDIDKNAVDKLRDKVSTIDMELEAKRREYDSLKKEYSEITDVNQKYKRTIEEVEKKTKKLKKMMKKKK